MPRLIAIVTLALLSLGASTDALAQGYQRYRGSTAPMHGGGGPGSGGGWNGGGGGGWSNGHGRPQYPPYQQHGHYKQPEYSAQMSGGQFQRPYPYHLDYYRMKWGGSYEPYFGNLYGPPNVVLGWPGVYGGPGWVNQWGNQQWGPPWDSPMGIGPAPVEVPMVEPVP